jgi:hypothetical protein
MDLTGYRQRDTTVPTTMCVASVIACTPDIADGEVGTRKISMGGTAFPPGSPPPHAAPVVLGGQGAMIAVAKLLHGSATGFSRRRETR